MLLTTLRELPERPVFLTHLPLPWPQTYFKINGPWNDLQIHPTLPLGAGSTQGRRSEKWLNLSGNLPWAPPAVTLSASFGNLGWLSKQPLRGNKAARQQSILSQKSSVKTETMVWWSATKNVQSDKCKHWANNSANTFVLLHLLFDERGWKDVFSAKGEE